MSNDTRDFLQGIMDGQSPIKKYNQQTGKYEDKYIRYNDNTEEFEDLSGFGQSMMPKAQDNTWRQSMMPKEMVDVIGTAVSKDAISGFDNLPMLQSTNLVNVKENPKYEELNQDLYNRVLMENSGSVGDQGAFDRMEGKSGLLTNSLDIYDEYKKYRYDPKHNKFSDKYRHAMMNCQAAQKGNGWVINNLSLGKEELDMITGSNTLKESQQDMVGNNIGRYLGARYPNQDCDQLIQKYIKKNY